MALATVESLASETRPDLSCLSCVIVCLSIPISSAISRMVESFPLNIQKLPKIIVSCFWRSCFRYYWCNFFGFYIF